LTASALAGKRIGLLHELVPQATTLAVMVNPTSPATAKPQANDASIAVRNLGLQARVVSASHTSEFEAIFSSLTKDDVGGLFVTNDAFFLSERNRLVTLAAKHRTPAIFESREFSEAGGLSSYGTNTAEMYRQAGLYAGRILRGVKPTDLPVMQPTKFELVLNLKTAKALGLTIPDKLLALADEVIE
jgi:putative ABC transport system substrate-binding protein